MTTMELLSNNLRSTGRRRGGRYAAANPLTLFIATIKEMGGTDAAKQKAKFKQLLQDDDYEDHRNAVLDDWIGMKHSTAFEAANPPTPAELRKRKAKVKRERKKIAAVKGKLIGRILTLVMPNGKQLADCTGAECVSFGGWLVKVGEEVGPKKLVKNVLNERQLKKLYASNK